MSHLQTALKCESLAKYRSCIGLRDFQLKKIFHHYVSIGSRGERICFSESGIIYFLEIPKFLRFFLRLVGSKNFLFVFLDKSFAYAMIRNRLVLKSNTSDRQHSTVVVHPTCNRKVVGSNPTAGLLLCRITNYLS